ncbi:MAG: TIGR02646 family protein [Bacteroidales bacterium]|nr:TIGR02646 family protein [Bacteroidales bacterium]
MLKINKGEPMPEYVSLFKRNDKPKTWNELNKIFGVFKIRDYILSNEQNGLCGYTELPISSDNTSSHLDHFKPRDWYHDEEFKWNNFIVASKNDAFGARYKDNHSKSHLTKDDYKVIYNPVESGMEDVVYYDIDGNMNPIDPKDIKVKRTIEVFNLNHNSLKERRKEIIRQVNSFVECGTSHSDIKSLLNDMGFPSVVDWELKMCSNE